MQIKNMNFAIVLAVLNKSIGFYYVLEYYYLAIASNYSVLTNSLVHEARRCYIFQTF